MHQASCLLRRQNLPFARNATNTQVEPALSFNRMDEFEKCVGEIFCPNAFQALRFLR